MFRSGVEGSGWVCDVCCWKSRDGLGWLEDMYEATWYLNSGSLTILCYYCSFEVLFAAGMGLEVNRTSE